LADKYYFKKSNPEPQHMRGRTDFGNRAWNSVQLGVDCGTIRRRTSEAPDLPYCRIRQSPKTFLLGQRDPL